VLGRFRPHGDHRAVGGFFYAATDATETESLAGFGRALAAATGGGRYALADWDEALRRLFEVVRDGLIVIDEFPYLSKATPALPSLIQRALGPRGYARRRHPWVAGRLRRVGAAYGAESAAAAVPRSSLPAR
jgi:AAA+ ATPase superfamily predicted ATPase